jgi:hypothetical protein
VDQLRLDETCPVHIHTTLEQGQCPMCLLDEITHRYPGLDQTIRSPFVQNARANMLRAADLTLYSEWQA